MDLYKAKYSDKKFDRYSKSKQTSSRNFRDDDALRSYRYSRDERPSRDRYSRDERPSRSSQNDFRTSKSKSEKFLKKTESFYSNGSEKFYSSLKEKLFEILG